MDSNAMTDAFNESRSDEPLVTVRTFGNEAEAAMAQGLLEAAGIDAFVEGGQTASAFGIQSISSVPLLVPKSRAEKATAILADEFDTDQKIPAWTCANCQEAVDAGYSVCWKCGTDYADGENASVVAIGGADSPSTPESTEELVNRAFRAALLAFIFPPIGLYSGLLVLRCLRKDISDVTIWKLVTAFVLSVIWGIVSWLMLIGILRGIMGIFSPSSDPLYGMI